MTPVENEFWNQYVRSQGADLSKAKVSAAFAGGRDLTDSLIQLYLDGKKWAGSGLVDDYKSAGDPLPAVGDFWIILDSASKPRLIVKTVRVELHPFGEIPEEIAVAEGEGDLSVRAWQELHSPFYLPHLEKWAIKDLDKALVVTEFFEVVFKAPP